MSKDIIIRKSCDGEPYVGICDSTHLTSDIIYHISRMTKKFHCIIYNKAYLPNPIILIQDLDKKEFNIVYVYSEYFYQKFFERFNTPEALEEVTLLAKNWHEYMHFLKEDERYDPALQPDLSHELEQYRYPYGGFVDDDE